MDGFNGCDLGKLLEMVRDGEAWRAAARGSPRVRQDLETEQQQGNTQPCTKGFQMLSCDPHTCRSGHEERSGWRVPERAHGSLSLAFPSHGLSKLKQPNEPGLAVTVLFGQHTAGVRRSGSGTKYLGYTLAVLFVAA